MAKKSQNHEPEVVELSEAQRKSLIQRIKSNKLSPEDQALMVKVLNGMSWLSRLAEQRKLSLRRLRRLFGFKTEKK